MILGCSVSVDKKSHAFSSYMKLLRVAKRYVWYFVVGIIATVAVSLLDAAATWFLKPLTNQGLANPSHQFIMWLPFILLGCFIFRGLAVVASNYFLNAVGRNVVMLLRQRLFQKYIHLPSRYFDKNNTSSLISKIIFNVDQVSSACSGALMTLFREAALLIGLIAVLFINSWQLTLVFFAIVPFVFLVLKYSSSRMRLLGHRVQNSMASVTRALDSGLRGQRLIKLSNTQEKEITTFNHLTAKARSQELKAVITNALSSGMIQFFVGIPLVIVVYLYFTYFATTSGHGLIVSFVAAMISLPRPVRRLTSINGEIQKAAAATESVFDILDLEVEKNDGHYRVPSAKGGLEFRDVRFYYDDPSHCALQSINVKIVPGEKIGLVGFSGAGKSTFVNLIPRYYLPQEGGVYLDGICLNDFDIANLRSHISYVPQNPYLFDQTIAYNVGYGCTDVSEADIVEALEKAYCMDFLKTLPNGIHSQIGQDGVQLSGGQRQRISIARAFVKNAPILILDEATSALDSTAEMYVQMALEKLTKGRTTLVIAHRLSTIEFVDRILVFDKGRIIEQGDHQSLIQKNGVYAQLYALQFKKSAINTE
jgi:ATP-binding cassette, subfamily B, bacterial MsbA